MRSVADYFSLWSEVPAFGSDSTTKARQPILLLGVVAGALGSLVLEWSTSKNPIAISSAVAAVVGGIASFPSIYYGAGLNRGPLSLAKWCLAFQNGFFWEAVLHTASQAIGRGGP
jgi:hypothetical protein